MLAAPPTHCACGEPLHYADTRIAAVVQAYTASLGEHILVTGPTGRQYRVQRHYLVLHGLKATDLEALAERGLVTRA